MHKNPIRDLYNRPTAAQSDRPTAQMVSDQISAELRESTLLKASVTPGDGTLAYPPVITVSVAGDPVRCHALRGVGLRSKRFLSAITWNTQLHAPLYFMLTDSVGACRPFMIAIDPTDDRQFFADAAAVGAYTIVFQTDGSDVTITFYCRPSELLAAVGEVLDARTARMTVPR